ncbi:MAG TPA: inositol monophosphatase [Candidatus Saccharimonadales bacterium]|nr:inositol monophosphatase [Candidatus Saccharimonadales bacterium]
MFSMFNRLPAVEGLSGEMADDLNLMVRVARQAGKIVCAGYNRPQEVIEKGYADLVSQIDEDCDQLIHGEIGRHRLGEPILSEEASPDVDISQGKAWVVDPIDATSAMLFRVSPDMPAVMLARTKDAVPQASVVYFPLTDELFWAARGLGAYKGKQRLHCQGDVLSGAWVELNQYGDVREESAVFRGLREALRRPGGARLVSSSPPHSGAGIRIAEGRKRLSAIVHDNNPHKVKQAPWDVLPIQLILHEAGGVVLNFNGEEYDPFQPEPFVMAASRRLAEQIIALVKQAPAL